jgi:hypothetical protein
MAEYLRQRGERTRNLTLEKGKGLHQICMFVGGENGTPEYHLSNKVRKYRGNTGADEPLKIFLTMALRYTIRWKGVGRVVHCLAGSIIKMVVNSFD